MRFIKIISGLLFLTAAVWLGLAALAGFSHQLTDPRTASAFAVFSVGLGAAGVLLVLKRRLPLTRNERVMIIIVLVGCAVPAAVLVAQVRSRSISAEAKMRQMLNGLDEELKKKGFVKVGENSWELPKNAGTNQPNPAGTNATNPAGTNAVARP